MAALDWENLDLERITAALREAGGGSEAEKMIWAFEEALRVARVDPDLVSYVLAAAVCLLSWADEVSPRDVLEAFWRRSVTDEEWRATYKPLLG